MTHVPFIQHPTSFFRVVLPSWCLFVCSRVYNTAHSRNKGVIELTRGRRCDFKF